MINNSFPHLSSIKIMTYNIHSCVGNDGKYSIDRIASVINSVSADIVCIQEVENNTSIGTVRKFSATHNDDQPSLLATKCGFEHIFFQSSLQACVSKKLSNNEILYHNSKYSYGNAILTKFAHLEKRVLHYAPLDIPTTSEPYYIKMDSIEQPRIAQAVLLKLPTFGKIWIVNTHLSHKPWTLEPHRQVRKLLNWMNEISHGLPIILCGDLNVPPIIPYSAYSLIMRDTRFGIWRDSFLVQKKIPYDSVTIPSSVYNNHHAKNKDSYILSYFKYISSMRIDYILLLCPLNMTQFDVEKCTVVNSTKNSVIASDHCPVVVLLRHLL